MKLSISIVCLSLIVVIVLYVLIGIMGFIPAKDVKPYSLEVCKHKVAVHVTGVVRDTEAILRLYKYIVEPLKADVFVNSPNYPPGEAMVNIDSSYETSNMVTMYKRMYELQTAFDEYSVTHNKYYDVVIRVRPDILFRDYIPYSLIEAAADDTLIVYPKNTLRHSINTSQSSLPATDTFFYSSVGVMREINNSLLALATQSPRATGEDIFNTYISTVIPRVYTHYGYELLLSSHHLLRLNLIKFIWGKLITHWPW